MLSAIMQELNHVGVMAMELCHHGWAWPINELAPRVHNSGHWTQNGSDGRRWAHRPKAWPTASRPTPNLLGGVIAMRGIKAE